MKKVVGFLVLILFVIPCIGCTDNDYRDSSNWNVEDAEFMDDYYYFYITNIDAIANGYNLGLTQEIIVEDVNRFTVSYYDDDEIIRFSFLNSTGGYGMFRSRYYYFNAEMEKLFDFSRYSTLLSFVSDVNAFVAFDYQGDSSTYQELYNNNLGHESNTDYYHFDSVVGNIGYWVMWGDNFSETETRWYIAFKYTSLLKVITE